MSGACVLAVLLAGGAARAAEYRRLTLMDGRVIVAEMQDMTANALVLRLPQGTMRVAPTQVMGMETVDEASWSAQEPWDVLVVPFVSTGGEVLSAQAGVAREVVTEQVAAIPATRLLGPADLARALTAEQLDQLQGCGIDAPCAVALGRDAGADLIVMGSVDRTAGGHELMLATVFPRAPRAQRQVSARYGDDLRTDRAASWSALHTAVFLDPSAPPPVETVAGGPFPESAVAEAPPASEPLPSARVVRRLSWVPVPGLPSLVRRDWQGFALCWTAVVPASIAMVGAAGEAAPERHQFALVGIGSYAILAVAANRGIGLSGLAEGVPER